MQSHEHVLKDKSKRVPVTTEVIERPMELTGNGEAVRTTLTLESSLPACSLTQRKEDET